MGLPAIPTGLVRLAGRLGGSGRHSDWILDDSFFPFFTPPLLSFSPSPFNLVFFLSFSFIPLSTGQELDGVKSCFTDVTNNGLRDSELKRFTDDDREWSVAIRHSLSDENPGCNARCKSWTFLSHFSSFSSSSFFFSSFFFFFSSLLFSLLLDEIVSSSLTVIRVRPASPYNCGVDSTCCDAGDH